MIKKAICVLEVMLLAVMCAGCGSDNAKSTDSKVKSETVAESPTPTEEVTVEKSKPIVDNTSGKVMIQCVSGSLYEYNSYMISSKEGENIVLDPNGMPTKDEYDMKVAAITSTHDHTDHKDPNFWNSYPDAKQLFYVPGKLKTKDFEIENIASCHQGDDINPKHPNNAITIVKVDGFKIVHMGDCGQTKLTEKQVAKLKDADVCFMQYTNDYSKLTADDGIAASVMEQINPKIIIPTHYKVSDMEYLDKTYGEIEEFDNVMYLDKELLAGKQLNMCRILNNVSYQ